VQVNPVDAAEHLAVGWQGLLLQPFWTEHFTSGSGSGRVPGGQEHFGLWPSGRQTAFLPHVSGVHTSKQVLVNRSQNLVGGQSVLERQLTALQPRVRSLGSPVNLPGGQVHWGTWFWVMQTAWGPQEMLLQAGTHLRVAGLHVSSSEHWASDWHWSRDTSVQPVLSLGFPV
jgi:hypothetical protein